MAKTFVYFILSEEFRVIKVGISSDPHGRFAAIQSACPLRLELLYWFPGERKDERELHEALSPWGIRGEWFGISQGSIEILNEKLDERARDRISTVPGFMAL